MVPVALHKGVMKPTIRTFIESKTKHSKLHTGVKPPQKKHCTTCKAVKASRSLRCRGIPPSAALSSQWNTRMLQKHHYPENTVGVGLLKTATNHLSNQDSNLRRFKVTPSLRTDEPPSTKPNSHPVKADMITETAIVRVGSVCVLSYHSEARQRYQ